MALPALEDRRPIPIAASGRFWLWVVLLSALVSVDGWKIHSDLAYQNLYNAWQAARPGRNAAAQAFDSQLFMRIVNGEGERFMRVNPKGVWTRADAERAIRGSGVHAPLTWTDDRKFIYAHFVDPQSLYEVRLGFSKSNLDMLCDGTQISPRYHDYVGLRQLCDMICVSGVVLLVLSLLLLPVALMLQWRYRVATGQFLLAYAFVLAAATICWDSPWQRLSTLEHFYNQSFLPVGLAILIAGTWIVIPQPKFFPPPYPVCKGCGYNLSYNVSGICPECGKAVAGLSGIENPG